MSLKIYKASAGSGKTFKLALEYLTLALKTDDANAFAHILAVTFTNKATAEMKERILTHLYKLANGLPDKDFKAQLEATTGETPQVLKVRAGRVLERIVHDFDHFRVETIDSFFQSMLSNLAHDLGLARNFRVSLETNEVIERSVTRMLLAAGVRKGPLSRLTKIILDYMLEQINQDDGWKIEKGLQTFAQRNLFAEEYLHHEQEIEAALKDTRTLSRAKDELTKRLRELTQELEKQATETLRTIEDLPPGSEKKTFKGHGDRVKWVNALLEGKWHTGLLDMKMTKAMQQALDGETAALMNKKDQNNADYAGYCDRVIATLLDMESLRSKKATELLTVKLILKSWSPLTLLHAIGKGVTELCNETGTFMLTKTTDLFQKMVTREDASFIFERAGITFHHVLIDEFQDTSRQQWSIFRELLLENMANNEECMIVGDVKQSIYRWRNGDWKILKDNADELKRVDRDSVIEMNSNYRSDRVIVDFNNTFFETTRKALNEKNAADTDDKEGLVEQLYEDVTQIPHETEEQGYVRIAFSDKLHVKNEAMNDLARMIRMLHGEKGVAYSEMMILVRKNMEAGDLVNYFAFNFPDIPLTSSEAYFLGASPSVKLLVEAMRLLNTADDGTEDKGKKTARGKVSVAEAYCRQTLPLVWGEGPDAAERTEQAMRTLKEKRKQWLALPLYELCKQLMKLFGLPETEEGDGKEGIGQSAYLFAFLDHVIDFLNEHASDVTEFLAYWDETLYKKQVVMNEGEAIQILTVHKSKGLEKHTVFIPFCNWMVEKDYEDDSLWCETAGLPEPLNALPALPLNCSSGSGMKHSVFAPYYNQEILMKRIDAFNELYVAFTRPRHNLFVWAHKANTMFRKSIYPIIQEFMHPGSLLSEDDSTTRSTAKKAGQDEEGTDGELWEERIFGSEPAGTDLPAGQAAEPANGAYRPETPFDTKHVPQEEVCLQRIAGLAEFRQSNRAKEFIAEQVAGTDGQAERGSGQNGLDEGRTGRESKQEGRNEGQAERGSRQEGLDEVQAKRGSKQEGRNEGRTERGSRQDGRNEGRTEREKRQEYIDEGKLIHHLFSLVRTADDVRSAGERLWNKALVTDRKKLERLCRFVSKRIGQPNIAPWFTPDWQVFAECSLLLPQPDGTVRTLRPDRVMTRPDETIVIDYKFGAALPEHEDQVRQYMSVLKAMNYPNVRGYLLYGYKGEVREVAEG